MNQFNESGGDDQSEDGQWRSAEDDISHEEEGDTADSLDIKPPQANRTENRYKEKKSSKEKKHSRERRHRERERNNERERDDRRHRHRERDERYDNISTTRNKNEMMRYEQAYRESASNYRQNYKDRGHEKNRVRDKDKNRDRRKESVEKSENDKVLEELDLRSRLLRNRTKYESEKKPDDRLSVEYENKRSDKEYFKYEYENRREKDTDRNEHHYHHGEYYRDRKQMVELIDSPENYTENVTITHHKKEKDRRPVTAEEKEHAARRAKLIEAEREMARRKELAREELEARREMRREREETRRESTATPPGNIKKRKNSTGEDDEKKKPKTSGDIVTVSDNSEEENDSESDSSNSRTEEEEEEGYEAKEISEGEELPSPLSIGELSKTELKQKTRTRWRSNSRSRSNSEDTRSRSRSTSKSESPRSRSRSRSHSSRQKSKSNSPRYRRRNDDIDEGNPDINENREGSHERERNKKDNDYKNSRHDAEATDQEDEHTPLKSPEIIEPKEELTPYFPAIQGCRSVEEFQCLNRIEEGTYGVVYRAKDKRTEEIVALKRLKMEKEKEGFPITSLREINTLLKGQHPNIVTVREIVVGSNMDKIFIVMDYVEHDLKSLMETMKHKKQVFLPGEVKCLTQQLLRAVAHLHDNWILHRDLKTSNLLLSHKGILKVGDFGLAREYGSPLKPYTLVVVTLWYRAPELLLCCQEYSIPIDMWSVGCIFAEFLAMAALFPGKSEGDQLNRIFKDLGTPNERIWPGYNELPAVQKVAFTEYPVSNLRKKFAHLTSELGLSLLQGLLTYDPKQRLSAEQALKSNYFKELPLPIDPAMFPTWPAKSELGSWKPTASPKPPSGGSEFKNLGADDGDQRWGATLMDSRQLAMGPGFSLKF